jgi:hypothetical protein
MYQIGWMFSNALGMFYSAAAIVATPPPPPGYTEIVTQSGLYFLTDSGSYIVAS